MTEQLTGPTVRHKRCRTCSYVLDGLAVGECPECSQPFDLSDSATFTFRVPLQGWMFWLPGLMLATTLGGGVAYILITLGYTGAALTVGVPLSVGAILGYYLRAPLILLPLVILAVLAALYCGAIAFNISGMWCGLTLIAIFVVPLCLGLLLAGVIALFLGPGRGYSIWPIIVFAVLPLAWAAIDRAGPTPASESISTSQ